MANTFRVPIAQDLFGLTVPRIVATVERGTRAWIEGSHMVLAYVLALLVVIHIVGELRRHFWKRNGVLRRMI